MSARLFLEGPPSVSLRSTSPPSKLGGETASLPSPRELGGGCEHSPSPRASGGRWPERSEGRRGALVGTVLLALLCPRPALAQQPPPAALPAAQPEQTGILSVIVFDLDGAPVPGARVTVDGRAATTDADGHAALSLPPGSFDLTVDGGGLARTLRGLSISPDMTTEALVTLLPPDRVAAEVESPDPTAVVAPDVGPTGSVTGIVRDEAGAPVAGARVFVRGQAAEATTDAAGAFSLELPVGTHDLSVVRSGFATQDVPGVVVEEGRATAAAPVALVEAGLTLTYEVTAPRIEGGTASLLAERKDSANVAEVLGAEEMSRAGDSSAASALKRVTGLTVVGGKYVYVRGLGERYSSTLLNGSMLPSPEPERRVVPLDLFPTSILESVVIQKTFSPDMPAEFGGGTVALRTKSVPDELIVDVGVSGTWTHGSTFEEGWVTPGGSRDWLGADDGTRALPGIVQEASDGQPLEEGDMFSDAGYSADELETFGEAVPNRWYQDRRTLPPDFGVKAALGHGFQLGEVLRAGALVAGNYDDKWDLDQYSKQYYLLGAEGALEEGHSYDFTTTEHSINAGGIGVAGVELFEDHQVVLTSVLARSTDDEARVYQGFNRDVDGDIRVTRNRWVERQLWYNQLRGTHVLDVLHLPGASGVEAEWRYAWSVAQRLEPDRREWRKDYEENTDEWLLSDRPEGNQMVYSGLVDNAHDVGVDLKVPFPFFWEGTEGHVKGGLDWMWKDRAVDTRRFKYMHKGERANADDVLALDARDIFVPENIGTDGFQYEEITRQTDNYTASQTIDAAYVLVEVPVGPSTRIMGGVRNEVSVQNVTTFELFNPDDEPVVAELETSDWLPAVTATQQLPADMQLRAGYGKTVNRPDFRELSPATFNDVTGGRQTYGNPDLGRATIDNFDLRWEWYPAPGESVSIGGFYKVFTSPIEQIVIVSAQHSVTYDNADQATDLGVEFDWRKYLGFVGPAGESLYVAGNIALVRSRVELGENSGIQSSNERALQGQSPYVFNAQLGWDDVDRGTRAALLYNVFGPRITDVGALGAPDSYELPVHQLDLVASQGLPGGFQVSLKAKNLLDWPRRETQGDRETRSLREGWSVGAGLSWSL